MTGWPMRRFWAAAAAVTAEGGFAVALDGRPVQTPARAPLLLPTRRLALAIAAEWAAQPGTIDPATMPLTRAANAAIDRVMPAPAAVAAEIAGWAASDLICYRAGAPAALVARQAAAWDPLLAFAAEAFGAPLRTTAGVMPLEQPRASLARLQDAVRAQDAFALTALSELVSLSGSLVIGLAVVAGRDAAAVWPLSRIDETWQAELWGADAAAEAAAAARRAAFLSAARFLDLARPGDR
jgi:chaperone required for assembly of F1-ATPase